MDADTIEKRRIFLEFEIVPHRLPPPPPFIMRRSPLLVFFFCFRSIRVPFHTQIAVIAIQSNAKLVRRTTPIIFMGHTRGS